MWQLLDVVVNESCRRDDEKRAVIVRRLGAVDGKSGNSGNGGRKPRRSLDDEQNSVERFFVTGAAGDKKNPFTDQIHSRSTKVATRATWKDAIIVFVLAVGRL